MAGMITNYLDNPGFMRKLQAMNPDELNILDQMLVAPAEGAIKDYISRMRMGTDIQAGKEQLGLRREELTATTDIRNKELGLKEEGQKQDLALGLAALQTKGDIARKDIASTLGIKEKARAVEKKQAGPTMGIGLTNVALSGILGYQKAQRDTDLAKKYLALAQQIARGKAG